MNQCHLYRTRRHVPARFLSTRDGRCGLALPLMRVGEHE